MIDIIAIFTLIGVIVIQALERVFNEERQQTRENRLLEEISRANKALVSKSAQDYVMMTAMDKTAKEEPKTTDQGQIDSSELTDEEFDKLIERQNS